MTKHKLIFLIQPKTNLLDLGSATQACLEAIDFGLDAEIVFCTYDSDIISTAGLPLGNIKSFSKVKLTKGDIVFILSTDISYILSKKYIIPEALFTWLNEGHKKEVLLCAICNGAFLLGHAGLLNDRKCTTHWKRTKELQEIFPKALVQENIIYVDDNNVITSAGAVSGIDVTLYVIAKLKNEHFAHKIARELVMYQRRNGQDSQNNIYMEKRHHVHTGIHLVQDYISQHIDEKLQMNTLADLAAMSYRNFNRVFKKETGSNPMEYINLVRREKAITLMQNPDLSMRQIANLVGLKSERHLQRILSNN